MQNFYIILPKWALSFLNSNQYIIQIYGNDRMLVSKHDTCVAYHRAHNTEWPKLKLKSLVAACALPCHMNYHNIFRACYLV